MNRKRVTFIRPSIEGRRASDAMEPLVFAILKALTPEEWEIRFHDERIEEIPFDEPTDLVAMTIETYTALRAYEIAAAYRARGVAVVAGGYHPTLVPQECLRYVDAVAIGDAEPLWAQILADASSGSLQPIYRAASEVPMEGLGFDRSIFAGKRYAPVTCVQFSRGCRYSCEFCSIHAFYGRSGRSRPPEEVVAEIVAAGRRHVLIVDDNLFVDLRRFDGLLRALKPLNIRWACQISMDVVKQRGLIERMADAGCIAALVGFESLDEGNLSIMSKSWNAKMGGYDAVVRSFASHGIMVYGSFVFGYDQDTPATFETTARWAIESGMILVNFSVLTPTPGTALHDRLKAQGRMVHDGWWLDHAYRYGDAVFSPRGMDPSALTRGTLHARQRFYSWSSMASRVVQEPNCSTLSHLGAFVLGNLISRKELGRKLGQGLGRDGPGAMIELKPVSRDLALPVLCGGASCV